MQPAKNKKNSDVQRIKANKTPQIAKKQTNTFEMGSFNVVYEVAQFKFKIPGQPTQQIQGNQLDLSKYSQYMKSGDSWYILM